MRLTNRRLLPSPRPHPRLPPSPRPSPPSSSSTSGQSLPSQPGLSQARSHISNAKAKDARRKPKFGEAPPPPPRHSPLRKQDAVPGSQKTQSRAAAPELPKVSPELPKVSPELPKVSPELPKVTPELPKATPAPSPEGASSQSQQEVQQEMSSNTRNGDNAFPAPPKPSGLDKKQRKEASRKFLDGEKALRDGKFELAIRNFTEAIQLDPTEPHYYYRRSEAYLGIGNTIAADEDSDKAVEVALESAGAWSRRGVAHIALDNPIGATMAFNEARRFEGGDGLPATRKIIKLSERELAGHGYPIVDRLAEAAKRRPTEQPQSPKFSQIKEEDEDIHDSALIRTCAIVFKALPSTPGAQNEAHIVLGDEEQKGQEEERRAEQERQAESQRQTQITSLLVLHGLICTGSNDACDFLAARFISSKEEANIKGFYRVRTMMDEKMSDETAIGQGLEDEDPDV
ncbi:hypothetical protein HDK90DRAFT_539217 [Phyllosticta capitalensis]|uniref:TPR-like protein n=1 Tax=Phyllosticta capitalensis TaxID=121624 RepID=A0ABR1Z360_9PEZI